MLMAMISERWLYEAEYSVEDTFLMFDDAGLAEATDSSMGSEQFAS